MVKGKFQKVSKYYEHDCLQNFLFFTLTYSFDIYRFQKKYRATSSSNIFVSREVTLEWTEEGLAQLKTAGASEPQL